MIAHAAGWWSGWVGHAVHGEPATGAVLGFCFGAVFTLVPATLVWVLLRARMSWTVRAPWLAVAVALAGPNLLTLAVTVESGYTAVAAPDFAGATLLGTLAALAAVLGLMTAFRLRNSLRAPFPHPRAP